MSIRALFAVLLKLVGIYIIKDVLNVATQLVATFGTFAYNKEEASLIMASAILNLLIIGGLCYLFLYRPNRIINLLKLEEGFKQKELSFNVHRSTMMGIAIMIMAGILLIDALPDFFFQLYTYLQTHTYYPDQAKNAKAYAVFDAVRVLIAYLLIIYQRRLVSHIELKRRGN